MVARYETDIIEYVLWKTESSCGYSGITRDVYIYGM